MNQFENISSEDRIVYLLTLSEVIIEHISSSEGFTLAVESLEKCWEWVKLKNIKAYDLYLYLENIDETDIMTYMQLEEDVAKEKVWICLGNALAYTISEAYRYEGEQFLRQTIESVDDDTVDSFLSNFNELSENHHRIAQKLLHVLQMNYSKTTDEKVDINVMRTLVRNGLALW